MLTKPLAGCCWRELGWLYCVPPGNKQCTRYWLSRRQSPGPAFTQRARAKNWVFKVKCLISKCHNLAHSQSPLLQYQNYQTEAYSHAKQSCVQLGTTYDRESYFGFELLVDSLFTIDLLDLPTNQSAFLALGDLVVEAEVEEDDEDLPDFGEPPLTINGIQIIVNSIPIRNIAMAVITVSGRLSFQMEMRSKIMLSTTSITLSNGPGGPGSHDGLGSSFSQFLANFKMDSSSRSG